jgi:hypothetical protein
VFENRIQNAVNPGGEEVTRTLGELDEGTGLYFAKAGISIPENERHQILLTGLPDRRSRIEIRAKYRQPNPDCERVTIRVTDSEAGGARFETTRINYIELDRDASGLVETPSFRQWCVSRPQRLSKT